jgi:hypothetical protein
MPLDDDDAVIWVGQPADPPPAPAAGRQARFIGDLSVDSDRRAALEMAEELFGGPVEIIATGSP